jgi:hypothetical protein
MTGLLLIVIFIIWLSIVAFVSIWAARRFRSREARLFFGVLAFGVLLPAPLVDEIIGKWQFESLCKKYAVVEIDEKNAMNRQVVYVRRKSDQFAEGTAVQIRIDPKVYSDVVTGKVLVSYHQLSARGGWLIRFLGISEVDAPLLFNKGCAPKSQKEFIKKFNIKIIN